MRNRTCKSCAKKFKPKREKQWVCSEQCLINEFDKLVRKTRSIARIYALTLGYKSMSEVRFANLLRRNAIKFEYEADKFVYQYKPQVYVPDFKVKRGVYLEYKGILDYAERKKLLAIQSCNPELDVWIVLESPNNKIGKGAKTKYWEWCEKHNFRWYSYKQIGKIKEDLKLARNKSKVAQTNKRIQSKELETCSPKGKV